MARSSRLSTPVSFSLSLWATVRALALALLTLGLASASPAEAAKDYGKPHPDAPEATTQLTPLVGQWKCKVERRQQDGTYAAPVEATWTFYWILDGYALMDEWRGPLGTGVNIRHVDPDTGKWVAKWLTTRKMHWETYSAEMIDSDFVMTGKSTTPTGVSGDIRVTFYDMQKDSFQWRLDWSIDEGKTWIPAVAKISATRVD